MERPLKKPDEDEGSGQRDQGEEGRLAEKLPGDL
jgi:hypothetical protein